jgi:dTMP kinase
MVVMVPDAHPLPRGLVVMFEGIDGAGKTTQVERVQAELEKAGWPVITLRNLGGTPIGEKLREVVLSPLERPPLTDFYISLAIQEPLLGVIDAARKEGKIILLDRGPLSLAAYQIYGSGVDAALCWPHVEAGMKRIGAEAILLYDTDVQTALGRKHDRTDHFESKPPEYFQKVADGYREAARRFSHVTTIDAAGSIDAVAERTLAAIAPLLQA